MKPTDKDVEKAKAISRGLPEQMLYDGHLLRLRLAIAQLLADQREAHAKVAERHTCEDSFMCDVHIAKAIRESGA